MKSIDSLLQDHRIMLRMLYVAEAMAVQSENGEDVDPSDIRDLIHFLRDFADEYHHVKEERALFPALLAGVAAASDPVRLLCFEHDQERSLAEGLEDALLTRSGPDFVYYVNRLVHIVSNHMYKEETILFPAAEKTLTAEQDEAIVRHFSQMDEENRRALELCMNRLSQLEKKYMRKVRNRVTS